MNWKAILLTATFPLWWPFAAVYALYWLIDEATFRDR